MKILITESQYTSLVRKTITESDDNNYSVWGCYNFPKNSESREWCDCSQNKIKANIGTIEKKIEYVKSYLKKGGFEDLLSNLKDYDEEDQFFIERLEQFREVARFLWNCQDSRKSLTEFVEKIKNKTIFVNKESGDYSNLNKLESNYTALSFLLTTFRENHKLYGVPFNEVFNSFFEKTRKQSESGEESYFTNYLINYFSNKGDEVEVMKKVFKTIEETSKIGVKSENEAYVYLVKRFGEGNVKNYAGDYSFVDLFGIDFMVRGFIGSDFIPVQIKSKESDLFGNSKICENIAMAKNKSGGWTINLYDGGNKIKSLS